MLSSSQPIEGLRPFSQPEALRLFGRVIEYEQAMRHIREMLEGAATREQILETVGFYELSAGGPVAGVEGA